MGHNPSSRSLWTFLTNHARVLITIARDPGIRLRDVAAICGLTERSVQSIVADLEEAGYLTRSRTGRRNRYDIAQHARFRHPAEADREVTDLLTLLANGPTQPDARDHAAARTDPLASAGHGTPDSRHHPHHGH
ncbi:helix-turn-helix domain-containing protein [Streptomyces sp. NPDC003038]|uniref:helix-turn-helix transcriptional regulator n=1 Tax=unclassified Streptomyces TaxID=2593676 RepID=UPI0033BCC834